MTPDFGWILLESFYKPSVAVDRHTLEPGKARQPFNEAGIEFFVFDDAEVKVVAEQLILVRRRQVAEVEVVVENARLLRKRVARNIQEDAKVVDVGEAQPLRPIH